MHIHIVDIYMTQKKPLILFGIYIIKVSGQNCHHLVIASVYNSICLQLSQVSVIYCIQKLQQHLSFCNPFLVFLTTQRTRRFGTTYTIKSNCPAYRVVHLLGPTDDHLANTVENLCCRLNRITWLLIMVHLQSYYQTTQRIKKFSVIRTKLLGFTHFIFGPRY